MFFYIKNIDNELIKDLQEYEMVIYNEFKKMLEKEYHLALEEHDLSYNLQLYRWIDPYMKTKREYDGYTATLQLDFLREGQVVLQSDGESVCSSFSNISQILYYPLRSKYRVYKADDLDEMSQEVEAIYCDMMLYYL